MKQVYLLFVFPLLFVFCTAHASRVVEFDSEEDFQRYQTLAEELRCPKCQNQNLKDSNSPISEDLRNEIERLIKEGRDDRYIKEFMVARYGDFVLYRPPVQNNTLVLWLGPVVMLGLGVIIFAAIVYQRSKAAAKEAMQEETVAEDMTDESSDEVSATGPDEQVDQIQPDDKRS